MCIRDSARSERVSYMRPPPGQNTSDENGNAIVWPLHRALYGTPNAGRDFAKHLHMTLTKDLKFEACPVDSCVYLLKLPGGKKVWCTSYVDDLLLAGTGQEALDHAYKLIESKFQITEMEPLQTLLGVHFTHDPDKRAIYMNQSAYITALAEKFLGEGRSTAKDTPCALDIINTEPAPEEQRDPKTIATYRSLVGSLLWLVTATRVDLAFSTSMLSRYLTTAGPQHLKLALRVLAYAYKTRAYVLTLGGTPDPSFEETVPDHIRPTSQLLGYSDASWGGERPMGGMICFLNGHCVLWSSKRHESTSLSSIESENLQATKTCVELLWLRELIHYIEQNPVPIDDVKCPTPLLTDSQGVVALADSDRSTSKIKHVKRRIAFLRETQDAKKVLLVWQKADLMLADVTTKPLSPEAFHKIRRVLLG